jgi:molybdenum cofactor guanylyltransferase
MPRPHPTGANITGVILAGGRGRRMGGVDKGLVPFAGRPMIEWVMDALNPQVGALMISANRNREVYCRYGIQVVSDMDPGFKGPLAGMASAMRVARTDWILTVPCDGPLLPTDLAGRLIDAMTSGQTELAAATSGGRIQPVYALLPTGLADELKKEIASGSQKVEQWMLGRGAALADFSDQPKAFANINSMEDAERLAREMSASRRR